MSITEPSNVKMPTKTEWLAEAKRGQELRGGDGQMPPAWTLWEEATSMCTALDKVSEHCRRTVVELQQRIIELDNMVGKMSKRNP